ncbi:type III secretion system gatekeeper subunit SctW [Rouxiella badensis]|jgi:type III secretion system YopN/LcrE/InvE/MxiC family regulator|uniref:SepL/TyeA/HrpJ family type III secretion system gatekeeper n=1 Tax=Rouxiella badensis TaxID=1646377 RepID=A0A1X0WI99_9GAMM|nr:type III secretion system gatekeeper subunit SctW [Rouxiella badensis]MCC3703342.1 type III secretion system gatekeeper subunit SctW [Rouxiella badensis]MCC3718281.1 type III secretion system gatekeeper subunit SctW [Rouxiella badensis]MCC3726951.1 type III secretion system gatekeeper subunit SctW [Rouxiella badensis]MCC3731765.1 type III secretion system gatekeeper subunit SctW [Rouxiella badensis]MCC3738700.1 type III secretion system gatekeeper subunit SctW [Rouxiella badensis]
MQIKVEHSTVRAQVHAPQNIAAHTINHSPLRTANIKATQVTPANSAMEMAKNQLEPEFMEMEGAFPTDEAMYETQENIGFTIGSSPGRGRGQSGGTGGTDRSRPRSMVQKLVKAGTASEDEIKELRSRIGGIEEAEEVDDLLNSMKRNEMDAGEMALMLGSMLNEENISPSRRKKLQQALNKVMDDEDWLLQLFGSLEFGSLHRSALGELRRLYQKAASRQSGLNYWFSQFRQLKDRKRKMKTLIRALAFELSAENDVSDIRLAAVVTDLKRILQFMTIEDHSQKMAKDLKIPEVTGDRITEELLEIVQQSWVYSDWLYQRASSILPEGHSQHGYARRMVELVKMLPEACFEDVEQRETVMQAFSEYQERLADEDE